MAGVLPWQLLSHDGGSFCKLCRLWSGRGAHCRGSLSDGRGLGMRKFTKGPVEPMLGTLVILVEQVGLWVIMGQVSYESMGYHDRPPPRGLMSADIRSYFAF